MKKRHLYALTGLWLLFFIQAAAAESRVLVLPFKNLGKADSEALSTEIAVYINGYLEGAPGYSTYDVYKVKQLLIRPDSPVNSADNDDTRAMLEEKFSPDFIIYGSYKITNGILLAPISIKDCAGGTTRSDVLTGECLSRSFAEIDVILQNFIADFIGYKLDTAVLTFSSTPGCVLVIGDKTYGSLPLSLRINAGAYDVQIRYLQGSTEKTVYHNTIQVTGNSNMVYEIPVFVPISVTADYPCAVYLDGAEQGTTPFTADLLLNQQYALQVIYRAPDAFTREVDNRLIAAVDNTPLKFHYAAGSLIRLASGNPRLAAGFSADTLEALPLEFKGLAPGSYTLFAGLNDAQAGKRWIVRKQELLLHGFEQITVDLDALIQYKAAPGLCWIPSAAQYHNFEPVKGNIVLSLFVSSLVVSAASAIAGYWSYREYDSLLDTWTTEGISGAVTQEQVNHQYNLVALFQGCLNGGLIAAGLVYCYSFLDGIYTMQRIDTLMH